MDIVLLERVEALGNMGDVVNVKPGYARNFLIPHGKALRATKDNIAEFESRRAELEARNAEMRDGAENSASDLDGAQAVLIRQASDSLQLYGSVNARDIANALAEQGFDINKRQVVLDHPIKSLGIHEVRVALHPEVNVTVVANVARSEDEAAVQAETGRAVGAFEEEEAEEAAAPAIEDLVEAEVAEQVLEDVAEAADEGGEDGGDEAAGDAEESPAANEDETKE
ncbi:MAG: 50S ribosomal protein L9 [Pseudomonadota bacterium]